MKLSLIMGLGALCVAALVYLFGPLVIPVALIGIALWGAWLLHELRPWTSAAVALGLAFLLMPGLAMAQVVAPAVIDVGGIYGAWRPYIVDIVGTIIGFGVGWLLLLLRSKFNVQIEDSRRDALQTALTNAAGLVLNSMGNRLEGKTLNVGSPGVNQAVDLVLKSAPDALASFGLVNKVDIAEKIVAKVPVVANITPAPASA